MRMVVESLRESVAGTIAASWLTMRKQPGNFCRTRQFRFAWRERGVAGACENFERNQSIDSAIARGTRLAWLIANGRVMGVSLSSTEISRGVVGMPGVRKARLIWGAIAFAALALG